MLLNHPPSPLSFDFAQDRLLPGRGINLNLGDTPPTRFHLRSPMGETPSDQTPASPDYSGLDSPRNMISTQPTESIRVPSPLEGEVVFACYPDFLCGFTSRGTMAARSMPTAYIWNIPA